MMCFVSHLHKSVCISPSHEHSDCSVHCPSHLQGAPGLVGRGGRQWEPQRAFSLGARCLAKGVHRLGEADHAVRGHAYNHYTLSSSERSHTPELSLSTDSSQQNWCNDGRTRMTWLGRSDPCLEACHLCGPVMASEYIWAPPCIVTQRSHLGNPRSPWDTLHVWRLLGMRAFWVPGQPECHSDQVEVLTSRWESAAVLNLSEHYASSEIWWRCVWHRDVMETQWM